MFKVGDLVCFKFKEGQLPQFYGKIYCIFGRTALGMLNDEVVILDGLSQRRVSEDSLRYATQDEIAAGHRLESSNGQAINHSCVSDFQENESQIGLSIKQKGQCEVLDMVDVSPNCEVRNG